MRSAIPEPGQFTNWCVEKLRNADTDQFHHVNHAVMASFFEAGRMELMAQPSVKSCMVGANLAVVQLLLNFHRELFYPGEIRIGSRIARLGNRSIEITQGMFDAQGCVASAQAVCVLLDPVAGRAVSIDGPLRAALLQ